MNHVDYVITLIHGTWARNAKWCQRNSAFCEKLAKVLEPKHILLYPFSWSGRNTPSARQTAAETLAADLQQLAKSYPRARHFIIAHSHGGNIACYLLRDHEELQGYISGLICLSTPFLYAQRRDLGPLRKEHFLSALTVIFMVIGLLICGTLDLITIHVDKPVADYAVVSLLLIACAAVGYWVGNWVTNASDNLLSKVTAKMQLPVDPKVPIFIVRSSGDEANAGLVASQYLTLIATKLWVWFMTPTLACHKLIQKSLSKVRSVLYVKSLTKLRIPGAAYTLAAILFVVLVTMYFGHFFDNIQFLERHPWLSISLFSLMAVLVIPIAYFSIFFVLISVLLVIGIPFGIELALSHVFLDLAVEPTPPGAYVVHQFWFKGVLPEGVNSYLKHSLVYEEGIVIAAIGAWISRQALALS